MATVTIVRRGGYLDGSEATVEPDKDGHLPHDRPTAGDTIYWPVFDANDPDSGLAETDDRGRYVYLVWAPPGLPPWIAAAMPHAPRVRPA